MLKLILGALVLVGAVGAGTTVEEFTLAEYPTVMVYADINMRCVFVQEQDRLTWTLVDRESGIYRLHKSTIERGTWVVYRYPPKSRLFRVESQDRTPEALCGKL